MARKKKNKPHNISVLLAIISFILVMIFAPRLDGPRIIYGIEFNTKAGTSGLTDLGLVLLVLAPIITYFSSRLLFRLFKSKDK